MLDAFFGNKSIERILFFLFVNGRCYATQMSKILQVPLTPLQKAFDRLEKEGIIISDFEGNTRFFQFNPAHPLLDEVELLLKKAYTLLLSEEKRSFYVPKQESCPYRHNKASKQKLVQHFWGRLCAVKRVAFHASTKTKANSGKESLGWSGRGLGEVLITQQEKNVLVFSEKGSWQAKKTGEVNFSNTLRWTHDEKSATIGLEHLRHGWDDPVFLFDLAAFGRRTLMSLESHLCGDDSYFGHLFSDEQTLRLHWRVIGPKKNEEIDYCYS
ncbi:MAG TPA: DUF6314 family protein [Chlamydiales bacterium]|nr:DUF6314 family protein [Chlamydiales bacterium]